MKGISRKPFIAEPISSSSSNLFVVGITAELSHRRILGMASLQLLLSLNSREKSFGPDFLLSVPQTSQEFQSPQQEHPNKTLICQN